ncbi:MAG: nitroreductase family protein [Candidatus Bathyarchaeota archaeon]|jgi:nitroreductase|nr:nitroreductase family protein [Candidatus Bathyarchaeota archaeon]
MVPIKVIEAIRERRSIRKFKKEPVSDALITQVMEAARLAPSGSNRQPWHLIVVRDPGIKSKMGLHKWAEEAPVIIVCCIDPKEGRWYIVDGSIAFTHMVLEATSLGLGTCWMGRLYENLGETDERIKDVLGIPDHMRVLAITPLGHHDKPLRQTRRKSRDEIVHHERFGGV